MFERVFGLESLAALPRLDDLGADVQLFNELGSDDPLSISYRKRLAALVY